MIHCWLCSAQSTLSHKDGDGGGSPGLTSELTTTDFTVNGLTSGGNIPILGLFFAFQEPAQSFAHNFLENLDQYFE